MTDIAYDSAGRIVCLIGPNDPTGILPPIAGRLTVPDALADELRPKLDAYSVVAGAPWPQLLHGGEPVAIPPEPGPTECSSLQAVMALDTHGYLSAVEQVIDAMGQQDWRIPLAWNRATVFRLDSPLLQEVATYVPGLSAALPDILRTAVQLQV